MMSEFLADRAFRDFRDYIYSQSGIHFSDSNRSILESRLKERLKVLDIHTPALYFELVRKDEEETRYFLDALTTNLTRFFRNQAHYDTFIRHVIPEMVVRKRKRGERKVRLWSAGCSTGEEPYTNAMVLKEHLPPGFAVEIIASDLSLKSLMKAKEGIYPPARVAAVPGEYLEKYFVKKQDGYLVKDEIKDLIRFDYHNLKFESGLENLDVVFCRNVLIYFDEAAQKNVIGHFWRAMAPHSYLFIGHSESLFGMNTKLEFIKTEWACLYGKPGDEVT